MIGIALVTVGVLFLFKNLGLISGIAWDIAWPVILIVLGGAMILKKTK